MRKIICCCLIALATITLTFAPIARSSAQDVAQVQYCWGTLRIVAGIAVCDGAAYNCTHPCPPPPPPPPKDPILVADATAAN